MVALLLGYGNGAQRFEGKLSLSASKSGQ